MTNTGFWSPVDQKYKNKAVGPKGEIGENMKFISGNNGTTIDAAA